MQGRFCRLEPLDAARHTAGLQAAFAEAPLSSWTYMPDYMGPHRTLAEWRAWLEIAAASADPLWHVIVDTRSGSEAGLAAYLRMDAASGSIEVGGLLYSPQLQRKPASTEAMYLMMRRAFDEQGYRRYEWKCDALNAPSRAAALRLGFTYEGIFRQHMVYRGRSRDTAWFSITDGEWPKLRMRFERWLSPGNFDGDGQQKANLSACG
ncbi:MAG TPA: GNAT family protein [Rhizomicrobium sp.]|jgi:RimJ/RimL family protein N-acetyltransferase|nr:GNAT family protein [Rhizomicrobium sp.]